MESVMQSGSSPRLRLSPIQSIASGLAAVTAAIAGSFLGVNGTVIGAAVASVLSVAGTAVYTHSLERTGARVRTVVPSTARWLAEPAAAAQPAAVATSRRTRPLARAGMAAAVVFAAALAVLTGIELVAGRPVSDLVTGKAASGTTVFGSQSRVGSSTSTPVPSVTVTVTPKVVVTTPTITRTAAPVTVTSTPSPTTAASSSTAPSTSSPGTPTGTTSP